MKRLARTAMVTTTVLGAMVLSACAPSGSANEPGSEALAKVALVTNFSAVADHAPYFVAQENGYYEDLGIEVDIQFGKGSADAAQRVGNGQSDISIVDTGTAIIAMGNGAEATIIGMLFEKSAHAVWTTKGSGVTTPSDLAGKTVGVPSTDTQMALFPALAKANDIDPDSITFVNVAPNAKYAALGSGQVDAIFDFTTGAPFVEQAVGDDAVSIRWADFGVNLYNNGIVANDEWLEANPELAKKFLEATYKGWQYSLENPDEAVAIMKKAVPTIDVETFTANFALGAKLFESKTYTDNGMGYINDERMCETVDIVGQYIEMDSKPKCETVYTNDYLPTPPVELPESMKQ